MMRFEKGKGSRKRSVTLNQLGAIVTKDEIDGPSEMLRGYRKLSSESSAREAIIQEAFSLLAAGLMPIDEAAKEIAALVPKKDTAKKASLPIRQDFYVYNEANGMMLTSRSMAGKVIEEGSKEWQKAVEKGKMLPLTLFQDDPFAIRVVVGGDLEAVESEEWVARVDWHLNVKDGKLCISGGAPLLSSDYEEGDSYYEQFVRELSIPKGHYRVRLYSYLPGINGTAVLDYLAGGYNKSRPLGDWFRKTRGGEEFPFWLKDWCVGDRSIDPGHEAEWEGRAIADEREWPDYIHFLAHLTPVDSIPDTGLSDLPNDGWFGEAENARIPQRCPLGLPGKDVLGRKEEEATDWVFAQDVFAVAEKRPVVPIAKGALAISLGEVNLIYRLAWFSARWAIPGLRATLPNDTDLKGKIESSEHALSVIDGKEIRFVFSNDLEPHMLSAAFAGLKNELSRLPEGTCLEFASVPPENLPSGNPDAGFQRYLGVIRDGMWQLERSYPECDGESLRRAIALAREVSAGEGFSVDGESEGRQILSWARKNFGVWLEDNRGEIHGGKLRVANSNPAACALYGAAAFAVRFGSIWPVTEMGEDDEDDEAEEDDNEEADPWDLKDPIQGALIFEAPSGRRYLQTMALLMSASLAEKIQAQEKALRKAKFRHIGDLVCDQFPKIAIRAYSEPNGVILARFTISSPGTLVFELTSRFSDGASLVTSRAVQIGDDLQRKCYRQYVPDGDLCEMLSGHSVRLAELETVHGKPITTANTLQGLAEDVEQGVLKQNS